MTEEANWDDNFEGDLTVKSPLQMHQSDPLETIRPSQAKRADNKGGKSSLPKSPDSKRLQTATRGNMSLPAIHQKKPPTAVKQELPSTKSYVESEEEDYSDLVADDTTFDVKFGMKKVTFSIMPLTECITKPSRPPPNCIIRLICPRWSDQCSRQRLVEAFAEPHHPHSDSL